MTQDALELRKYLETVAAEVRRRSDVVKRVEQEVAEFEQAIAAMRRDWHYTVRTMQVQKGFKEKLIRQKTAKDQQLAAARADLTRALEREASVRKELEEVEG